MQQQRQKTEQEQEKEQKRQMNELDRAYQGQRNKYFFNLLTQVVSSLGGLSLLMLVAVLDFEKRGKVQHGERRVEGMQGFCGVLAIAFFYMFWAYRQTAAKHQKGMQKARENKEKLLDPTHCAGQQAVVAVSPSSTAVVSESKRLSRREKKLIPVKLENVRTQWMATMGALKSYEVESAYIPRTIAIALGGMLYSIYDPSTTWTTDNVRQAKAVMICFLCLFGLGYKRAITALKQEDQLQLQLLEDGHRMLRKHWLASDRHELGDALPGGYRTTPKKASATIEVLAEEKNTTAARAMTSPVSKPRPRLSMSSSLTPPTTVAVVSEEEMTTALVATVLPAPEPMLSPGQTPSAEHRQGGDHPVEASEEKSSRETYAKRQRLTKSLKQLQYEQSLKRKAEEKCKRVNEEKEKEEREKEEKARKKEERKAAERHRQVEEEKQRRAIQEKALVVQKSPIVEICRLAPSAPTALMAPAEIMLQVPGPTAQDAITMSGSLPRVAAPEAKEGEAYYRKLVGLALNEAKLRAEDICQELERRMVGFPFESSMRERMVAALQFMLYLKKAASAPMEIFLVGGAIRQFMQNQPLTDLDFVCNVPMDDPRIQAALAHVHITCKKPKYKHLQDLGMFKLYQQSGSPMMKMPPIDVRYKPGIVSGAGLVASLLVDSEQGDINVSDIYIGCDPIEGEHCIYDPHQGLKAIQHGRFELIRMPGVRPEDEKRWQRRVARLKEPTTFRRVFREIFDKKFKAPHGVMQILYNLPHYQVMPMLQICQLEEFDVARQQTWMRVVDEIFEKGLKDMWQHMQENGSSQLPEHRWQNFFNKISAVLQELHDMGLLHIIFTAGGGKDNPIVVPKIELRRPLWFVGWLATLLTQRYIDQICEYTDRYRHPCVSLVKKFLPCLVAIALDPKVRAGSACPLDAKASPHFLNEKRAEWMGECVEAVRSFVAPRKHWMKSCFPGQNEYWEPIDIDLELEIAKIMNSEFMEIVCNFSGRPAPFYLSPALPYLHPGLPPAYPVRYYPGLTFFTGPPQLPAAAAVVPPHPPVLTQPSASRF